MILDQMCDQLEVRQKPFRADRASTRTNELKFLLQVFFEVDVPEMAHQTGLQIILEYNLVRDNLIHKHCTAWIKLTIPLNYCVGKVIHLLYLGNYLLVHMEDC